MKRILVTLVIIVTIFNGLVIYQKLHQTASPPFTPQVLPVLPPTPPGATERITVEQARQTINEKDAKELMLWLTDDAREGRMSGKKGNRDAAQYIKSNMESSGLKTVLQPFHIRRLNPGPENETGDDHTSNVIGTLDGDTDREIVIASHLDHVGWGPSMARDGGDKIHPGADDNASGCVGVMLSAKAFSKIKKPRHRIVFICFSAEEMGLIGSEHYVKQLGKDRLANIDLMVNFDMIGRLGAKGKTVEAIGARDTPKLTKLLGNLESKYNLTIEPKTAKGDNGSDQAPFYRAGVPVCFFFTGMHPQYHCATDTPDRINYSGLVSITQLAFELANEYDKE